MNNIEFKSNDGIIVNTRLYDSYLKLTSSSNNKVNNQIIMNYSSLKSLFINSNWNPLINGFQRCSIKGNFTRFLFVANSVENNGNVNTLILNKIFIKYGPLYDIFISKDKSKANIAFININDAINAYFDLNNKIHPILNRKLHLAFSQPRFPKVMFF